MQVSQNVASPVVYLCSLQCKCVRECDKTWVHEPSVCTFVGVSVVIVFMVKAVIDEPQTLDVNYMLDFCELFLCYSSSHTHKARLRSTFSILYIRSTSIIIIPYYINKPGVHLCCINSPVVTHTSLSFDSDADCRDNSGKNTGCNLKKHSLKCFY